jgi:hypothetical protein
MGVDLLSQYGPVVLENLLTWKGAAGVGAAIALGYLLYSIIPGRPKASMGFFSMRTGDIPFHKVGDVVEEYEASYGGSHSICVIFDR